MSHLLKRTKKSCLKLLRKISSKQIFLKRLEEDETPTDRDYVRPSIDALTIKPSASESSPRPKGEVLQGDGVDSVTNKTFDATAGEEVENERDLFTFDENRNNSVLQSLTSKLFLTAEGYEFQRLQQLRSDTASEVVQFEPDYGAAAEQNTENAAQLDIVFEKVKYKQNVRYLRHTPSSSSLDNGLPNDSFLNTTSSHDNTNRSLQKYKFNRNSSSTNNSNSNSNNNKQPNTYFPLNVSLASKCDGNYHHLIISEERDYFFKLAPVVVKWDINGNSLEDDLFLNERWDSSSGIVDDHYSDSAQSSIRSSSTTLETWLEDDPMNGLLGEPFELHSKAGLATNSCNPYLVS